MNEELKPCPFCKGIIRRSTRSANAVVIHNPMQHCPMYCGNGIDIVVVEEIWNHRPAEDAKWNEAIEAAAKHTKEMFGNDGVDVAVEILTLKKGEQSR